MKIIEVRQLYLSKNHWFYEKLKKFPKLVSLVRLVLLTYEVECYVSMLTRVIPTTLRDATVLVLSIKLSYKCQPQSQSNEFVIPVGILALINHWSHPSQLYRTRTCILCLYFT